MVKQFVINLNRQEGYAQRLERKRKVRDRITLTVITAFVLLVGYMTYTIDGEMRQLVQTKEQQLDNIVARIDSLQKAGQNVSKQDVLALARLDAERVLWTKKFAAIADIVPENMAVTHLEFERGDFELMAVTDIEVGEKEFEKVQTLLDKLRSTPRFMEDFRDIKFTQSTRSEKDGQELLNFTITCQIGSAGAVRARQATSGGSPNRSEALNRQLGG